MENYRYEYEKGLKENSTKKSCGYHGKRRGLRFNMRSDP